MLTSRLTGEWLFVRLHIRKQAYRSCKWCKSATLNRSRRSVCPFVSVTVWSVTERSLLIKKPSLDYVTVKILDFSWRLTFMKTNFRNRLFTEHDMRLCLTCGIYLLMSNMQSHPSHWFRSYFRLRLAVFLLLQCNKFPNSHPYLDIYWKTTVQTGFRLSEVCWYCW